VDRPAEPNFVFDDDGGKARLFRPTFSSPVQKHFTVARVLASVQQVSIFWAQAGVIRNSAAAKLPCWTLQQPSVTRMLRS